MIVVVGSSMLNGRFSKTTMLPSNIAPFVQSDCWPVNIQVKRQSFWYVGSCESGLTVERSGTMGLALFPDAFFSVWSTMSSGDTKIPGTESQLGSSGLKFVSRWSPWALGSVDEFPLGSGLTKPIPEANRASDGEVFR